MDVTRAHPRVDFFDPVRLFLVDGATPMNMFAANLSEGGVFLRSNRPLSPGTRVALEFETPHGSVRVEQGKVVWKKDFEAINVDGRLPGMGIQFTTVEADSRRRLEAAIARTLRGEPPEEPATEAGRFPARARGDGFQEEITARVRRPVLPSLPRPVARRPRTPGVLFAPAVLVVAIVTWFVMERLHRDAGPGPATRSPANPASSARARMPAAADPNGLAAEFSLLEDSILPPAPVVPRTRPEVGWPVFRKTSRGWEMDLRADNPVRVRTFTLDDPPRLVFDFQGARLPEPAPAIANPTPFIRSVRAGPRAEGCRIVLDLAGAAPRRSIRRLRDGVNVVFESAP